MRKTLLALAVATAFVTSAYAQSAPAAGAPAAPGETAPAAGSTSTTGTISVTPSAVSTFMQIEDLVSSAGGAGSANASGVASAVGNDFLCDFEGQCSGAAPAGPSGK